MIALSAHRHYLHDHFRTSTSHSRPINMGNISSIFSSSVGKASLPSLVHRVVWTLEAAAVLMLVAILPPPDDHCNRSLAAVEANVDSATQDVVAQCVDGGHF
jgi:hypothetical protein